MQGDIVLAPPAVRHLNRSLGATLKTVPKCLLVRSRLPIVREDYGCHCARFLIIFVFITRYLALYDFHLWFDLRIVELHYLDGQPFTQPLEIA